MKKLAALGILTVTVALHTTSVFAGSPAGCSLATLHGTYAWGGASIKNQVWSGSSGMESYDGQGHLKYFELQSDGVTQYRWTGTGTYTITANCIATVLYDGDTTDQWTYFVAPHGGVFYYNNNLGLGRAGGGQEDRISWTLLVQ